MGDRWWEKRGRSFTDSFLFYSTGRSALQGAFCSLPLRGIALEIKEREKDTWEKGGGNQIATLSQKEFFGGP